MVQIHRLPEPNLDDRRLIDVTVGEVVDAVMARLRDEGLGQGDAQAKPLDVNGLMEHYGVSDDQVYAWRRDGMPSFLTGDVKGLRAYVSDVDDWLKERKSRG
jgi:hypothetical protein